MAVEGSCCGQTSGTIPVLALRNRGKLQMTLRQPTSWLETRVFQICVTHTLNNNVG